MTKTKTAPRSKRKLLSTILLVVGRHIPIREISRSLNLYQGHKGTYAKFVGEKVVGNLIFNGN